MAVMSKFHPETMRRFLSKNSEIKVTKTQKQFFLASNLAKSKWTCFEGFLPFLLNGSNIFQKSKWNRFEGFLPLLLKWVKLEPWIFLIWPMLEARKKYHIFDMGQVVSLNVINISFNVSKRQKQFNCVSIWKYHSKNCQKLCILCMSQKIMYYN